MLKRFTKLMMRRNMMGMAAGILIGATFGKIVSSLVSDVITPPIGLLAGKADFSNLFAVLRQGNPPEPNPTLSVTLNYGFEIVGFSLSRVKLAL